MKRRRARERDEAAAREQAESRTEELLAQLKAHEAAAAERTEADSSDAPLEQERPETAGDATTDPGDG